MYQKNNMKIIAPSILSADFGRLNQEIQWLNQSRAEWLHIDIMDGVFVPNISFGFPVLKAIKAQTTKILDVHMMIVEPDRYIGLFHQAGADVITIHYEGNIHLHRTIQNIKKLGMKAGIALNPHTPVTVLQDILQEIDLVCLMSVNPGFGGQMFIERTYAKIQELQQMIETQQVKTLIEVDGGVNLQNTAQLWKAGAQVLVAGHSIFSAPDPMAMIDQLLKL